MWANGAVPVLNCCAFSIIYSVLSGTITGVAMSGTKAAVYVM